MQSNMFKGYRKSQPTKGELKSSEGKMKKPRCPKTLSGKHSWSYTAGFFETYMSGILACEYCGIINDTTEVDKKSDTSDIKTKKKVVNVEENK